MSTSTSLRQKLSGYTGSWRGRVAAVASITVFAVLAGTAVSWGYWTAQTTASSSVNAATLAVSTANFTSNAYTFGNETLTTTGSVTLSNTTSTVSTRVPALTLAFAPDAAATLAGKVALVVWPTAAAANCTAAAAVGAGSTSGTWASIAAVATTLAKSTSAVYCVRSTIASREDVATAGGALTFTPKITATLSVGNFAAVATATTTQSTKWIYPVATASRFSWFMIEPINTTQCLDVSGGGASAPGTDAISYPCKATDTWNQQWQLLPATTTGYVEIKPRNAPTLRADNNLAAAAGTAIQVQTDTSAANQQWQLQLVSTGVYQIVNRASGMCMTSNAGAGNAGAMFQAVCDNRDLQKFNLTNAEAVLLDDVVCTDSGTAAANYTVAFTWDQADNGPYTLQYFRNSVWTTLGTTAATATGGTVAAGQAPNTGNNSTNVTTRITDSAGTAVYTGTLAIRRTGSTYYLRCS